MNVRDIVEPAGFRSQEAAVFFAQLEDQTRLLTEGTRGLTPDELEWQPAPGMNTIGMLLAHLAVVEVFWTRVGVEDRPRDQVEYERILGIGGDDDGMPLAEGGAPPATLRAKDLAFYDALLVSARTYVRGAWATIDEENLRRVFHRKRPDGTEIAIRVRWVLYHVLEHFTGHFGQILLLRHQYRIAQASKTADAAR